MGITGDKDCFQVALINDDIAESVELFDLYLEAGSAEDNVTLIQHTLSIIITDDGELLSSCRPLNYQGFSSIPKVIPSNLTMKRVSLIQNIEPNRLK